MALEYKTFTPFTNSTIQIQTLCNAFIWDMGTGKGSNTDKIPTGAGTSLHHHPSPTTPPRLDYLVLVCAIPCNYTLESYKLFWHLYLVTSYDTYNNYAVLAATYDTYTIYTLQPRMTFIITIPCSLVWQPFWFLALLVFTQQSYSHGAGVRRPSVRKLKFLGNRCMDPGLILWVAHSAPYLQTIFSFLKIFNF